MPGYGARNFMNDFVVIDKLGSFILFYKKIILTILNKFAVFTLRVHKLIGLCFSLLETIVFCNGVVSASSISKIVLRVVGCRRLLLKTV